MENRGVLNATAGPCIPRDLPFLKFGMDDDAAGVQAQTLAKAFQAGLFGAPDQVDRKRSIQW